ncbi:MAG: Trk family potassium uptake protein [Clostridiales bacterium]|nr:Trk family potassium uptake protein [Clostridiales bacterium]MBS5878061.1 Trk family potassium uptake protein [Clostridiales bacterium]MDU0939293.1 potassium transporter TrkG [Clostridiales bacterium]MDU1042275.1 potassium transporter TrkG [Clostridiales bacterium]MDU3489624.1 potassium transporter TrkG [Clostridiales bacterium]
MPGKKRHKIVSNSQIMAFGFLMVILSGAVLLMMPIASKTGTSTNFLDCLFTSVSATCVTGLVVVDTFAHWTLFGQIVILLMIQIGGLGIITISAMLYLFFRQRIGLNMRNLIQESTFSLQLGGVVKSLKKIIRRALIFEGIGAVLLSTQFIPKLGIARGIWYGVFHSISAFCNAGFDLMGRYEEYSSLTMFVDNPVVNFTIMGLIMTGGLGFIVWEEIAHKKFNFRKYSLHSKLVLILTVVFVLGGTVLFLLFENDNLFAGMPPGQKFMAAMFASVTPRTAGFNTTDLGAMTDGSVFLTCVFMFIGGNSGSTAGGIKITTAAVIFAYIFSSLRSAPGVHIMKRRISQENINTASMVLGLNIGLIVLAMLVISAFQSLPIGDLLLEVFSGMGTVGLSTGITRSLVPVSKIVLMILMFSGRIGTVTFALSFRGRRKNEVINYPEERINVG